MVMTSLIVFIIIIIIAIAYIISVISDETDDLETSDALALDSDQFLNYPVVSPVNQSHGPNQRSSQDAQTKSDDKQDNDHSSCELEHSLRKLKPKSIIQLETSKTPLSNFTESISEEKNSKIPRFDTNHEETNQENNIKFDQAFTCGEKQVVRDNVNVWQSSVSTQKSLIINLVGGPTSKHIFSDFDPKETELGGTALHWTKTRKTLDKLLKLDIPLEAVNEQGETALHVAIRKRKLQVLIGLLCSGVDVNSVNNNGETPLIVACRSVDVFGAKLLLVFDADHSKVDKSGHSARHYISAVAERHKAKAHIASGPHLILAMLQEIGAERCLSGDNKKCSSGCLPTGTYNGNSYNRWPNFKKESLYKRHMFANIIDSFLKRDNQNSSSNSRLLCIDGGGMRGIIVCQMMIEIEKYLKRPLLDYFDWIGGTSAGAFVSCALCAGTSLVELRKICFDVKDEVFSGNRPYNSKFLERALKRTLGTTSRLNDIKGKRLAVTTVLADRDPCQLRFFRNYPSPDELLEHFGFDPGTFNNMSGHSLIRNNYSSSKSDESIQSIEAHSSDSTIKSSDSNPKQADSISGPDAIKSKQIDLVNEPISKKVGVTQNSIKDNGSEKIVTKPKEVVKSVKETSSKSVSMGKTHTTSEEVLDENEPNPFIWQAVRASAAAPFFFKPYGPFLDGGIISNNPTLDMMAEHQSYNVVREFLRTRVDKASFQKISHNSSKRASMLDEIRRPTKRLDMVVSLGTGRGRVVGPHEMFDFSQVVAGFATVFSPVELVRSIKAARDLFRKLLQRSCQTEDHILDRAQGWCSSLNIPYFRINPPLATNMSIDDKRDEQLINAIWQAKLYMISMREQLEQLGKVLDR